jgi:hypothetical protein
VLDTTKQIQTQITLDKTCTLLQTTGGKDQPNIVFYAEIVTYKFSQCTTKAKNNKKKSLQRYIQTSCPKPTTSYVMVFSYLCSVS